MYGLPNAIAYTYIIFCYFYRKSFRKDFAQDYYIIISICCGVLLSCWTNVITEIIGFIWDETNNHFLFSLLMDFRVFFGSDILHFLALLLSFFRFYASCKPIRQYVKIFSHYAILGYCALYTTVSLFIIAFKESLVCGRLFDDETTQSTSACAIIIIHHIYFLTSIIVICRLHYLTAKKLQNDINEEEQYLKRFTQESMLDPSSESGDTGP